jgi:hypothetical protein
MCPSRGVTYEVRIEAVLDESWAEWFDDSTVRVDGDETVLRCRPSDEAALHGLLLKVRDLGIPLISVNRIDADIDGPEVGRA